MCIRHAFCLGGKSTDQELDLTRQLQALDLIKEFLSFLGGRLCNQTMAMYWYKFRGGGPCVNFLH